MKYHMRKSFVLGFMIVAFVSCKKDTNSSKSKTELLSQKAWKIETVSVSISGISQNIPVDSCEKDDTELFAAAGTGVYDNGATKCNIGDDQTSSFTWSFKENETILSISGPNLSIAGDSKISIINENTLELYKDTTLSGISGRYTGRFKH